MALSGSFYTKVTSRRRLQIDWTGKQNISGNYTDITAKFYWIGEDQYSAIYSSATKTAGLRFNKGGWETTSGALAGIDAYQKRLIHTATKRINHNSDGTASFSIGGYFGMEVTISGVWYGTVTVPDKTFTLNTIPRASSLSSSANWTAGNNLAVSITRASTSFTHRVRVQVTNASGSYVTLFDDNGIKTSKTVSFSVANNTTIFQGLDGGTSTKSRIYLDTYNGSTLVGSKTYNGTIKAPSPSKVTSGFASYFYTDANMSGNISRSLGAFTHTLQIKIGGYTKVIQNVGTSFSWTPSSSEEASIYNEMKTVNKKKADIYVTTYYNGVKVQTNQGKGFEYRIRNANPTFSASQISYADINSATTALTGNNQAIIQNVSKLRAYVNSGATGKKGASIVSYAISVAGKEGTLKGTGNVTLNELKASTNQSLSVRAIDSRGNSTTVTKVVTMIPYEKPAVVAKIDRDNNFDTSTLANISGTFSALSIGGANKNAIQSVTFRYGLQGSSLTARTVTFSTASGKFTGTKFAVDMDNTKTWSFEVEVVDKISSTKVTGVVAKGQPLFYLDAKLGSLGFNDLPSRTGEFLVNGAIRFGASRWITSKEEGAGGIIMNNSDITEANGIFFNDIANNTGEGLMFIKSGKPEKSTNKADYDQLSMLDGKIQQDLGKVPVTLDGGKVLGNLDVTGVLNAPEIRTGNIVFNGKNSMNNDSGDGTFLRSESRFDFRAKKNGEMYTNFVIGYDGVGPRIYSNSIFERTYSNSANMYITSAGTIGRVTSASKYKLEIEPAKIADNAERLLELDVKSWYDKAGTEAYADYLTKKELGEEVDAGDIPYVERSYGLIAEELAEVGLSEFVAYGDADENGNREIEGIQYDRVWTLLIPIVKRQAERIEALENKLQGEK